MKIPDKEILALINDYKSQLAIPASKPPIKFFICPVGLVGSGKTTIIKPLAEKLSLVRISSDEIRKMLKERGYDYESVRDIVAIIIKHYADVGYGIAVDADCGNPETQVFVEKIAIEKNMKIFWLHVNPPEDFILNKLRNHPPTWLASDGEIMVKNYFDQKELRKRQLFPHKFLFTFDTSRPDILKQIEDATLVIKEKISKKD